MGWWRALRLAKCLGHVRGGLLVATAAVVVLAGAPVAPLMLVEDELLLALPFAPTHPEGACGAH